MKKVLIVLGIVFGVILIISVLANLGSTDITKDVKVEPIAEKKANWSLSEITDKMTSVKKYYAVCKSTNTIEFQFPYQGGSYFTLTVRNSGKGNEVVINVSKGQFMPSLNSEESVKVKFDDGKPIDYTYLSASDGSSDVIFLNNENNFIKKLKVSKKLMIETTFFNEGSKIMEFDINGLNWKH